MDRHFEDWPQPTHDMEGDFLAGKVVQVQARLLPGACWRQRLGEDA